MNIFERTGSMAIGSRLRMISERITEDAAGIYKMYGIDFEPKWWPVFYVLSEQGQQAVTAIAKDIGHSHPSVSKIAREMIKAGLIQEEKDPEDKRRNLLTLSKRGEELNNKMQDTYKDVTAAVEESLAETRHNLWKAIDEYEYLLSQKSLLERVRDLKKKREIAAIEILDYNPSFHAHFKALNEEWIRTYFTLEQIDIDQLNNPEKYILSKGGHIFMAREGNEVLGTCALKPVPGYTNMYELAKMAVSPTARGKGIGMLLGKAIISKARELGAEKLYLESNTILKPALNLYRKMGFRKVTGHTTPYERSNIQMEMEL